MTTPTTIRSLRMKKLPPTAQSRSGFSLVEVVLALGICSFAMLAIVGMIPVGLSTFQDAMTTTVQSQIMQRIAGDVLLADYSNLAGSVQETYYNEQGTSVDAATAVDLAYTARVYQPEDISEVGAELSVTPGEKVVIKIARTSPGQVFETVETQLPRQVASYSVVVSKN